VSVSFSASAARRAVPSVGRRSAATDWMAIALVGAAVSFNFFLCFINTNVTAITSAAVIGSEIIINFLALGVALQSATGTMLIATTATVAFAVVLALARSVISPDVTMDIKIARDLLIPFAFFMLGCRITDLKTADLIVKICAVFVVVVGAFEYFFLDTFLHYFNVIMYYVGRGSVEMQRLELLQSNLFVSGLRPEGRSLLPFLGDRRVSSIFLEPVSPGNFAVIIFCWSLVRAKVDGRFQLGIFMAAAFIVIMADNRFGAYLCALSTVFVLLPPRVGELVVGCLPPLILVTLLATATMLPNWPIDDSMIGRTLSAGRVLAGFDPTDWLGLGKGAEDAFDSGYAYTISQIGLPAALALWLLLINLRSASAKFQRMKTLTGLYLSTILAVSYSPYTIKTASLLWFLLGALYSEGRRSCDGSGRPS
jgi:putative polymerase